MTLRLSLASVLIVVLTQSACAAAPPAPPASPAYAKSAEAAPGAPPSPGSGAATTPVAVAPSTPSTSNAAKGKTRETRAPSIIFQGDMKMLADEDAIPKTIDRIIDIAEGAGGHVASRKDANVQVKVPSISFRETMKSIDALGGVTSQSIGAEDVSEEMHDLDVRLSNLRATRARLQELLGKAGAIPDVLTVEKELERVALEIDRIEGRLEFLKTRTSLSVIDVHLTPKPKVAAPIVASASPPSKPRILDLPVPWIKQVGIDPLLSLSSK